MTRSALVAAAMAALLLATSVDAGPKGNKGNGNGNGDHGNGGSAANDCPPGLAKKDPPCIPPGLAKKRGTDDDTTRVIRVFPAFDVGDLLPDDHVVLVNPQIYRPGLNAVYVRYGDYIYLVDRDSADVLGRIGSVSDWTWSWGESDFANCPPGLAKKNPPCVPPGLANKGVTVRDDDDWVGRFDPYGIGDRLPDDYDVIIDPLLFRSDDNSFYVRQGDTVYRIDRETGVVLDRIGTIGDLLG